MNVLFVASYKHDDFAYRKDYLGRFKGISTINNKQRVPEDVTDAKKTKRMDQCEVT